MFGIFIPGADVNFDLAHASKQRPSSITTHSSTPPLLLHTPVVLVQFLVMMSRYPSIASIAFGFLLATGRLEALQPLMMIPPLRRATSVKHTNTASSTFFATLLVEDSVCNSRRTLLEHVALSVVAVASSPASAAAAVDIKVTPLAHTFITSSSGGSAPPKPLRENDATRYLTNARVVYFFCGDSIKQDFLKEVLELTTKRKADQGPGVTPGTIHVAATDKDTQSMASNLGLDTTNVVRDPVKDVVSVLSSISNDGDTLIVGPIATQNNAEDAKVVDACAQALGGLSVGGGKSGGVLSVLLDGPRENYNVEQQGSTILWYSV